MYEFLQAGGKEVYGISYLHKEKDRLVTEEIELTNISADDSSSHYSLLKFPVSL